MVAACRAYRLDFDRATQADGYSDRAEALEAAGVAEQALSRVSVELVRNGLGRETRRGTAQSGPDPFNGWVLGALEPESLQALGALQDHSPASYLKEIASRTR